MEALSISNVHHWLVSWPFNQSSAVIILTICGLFLTPLLISRSSRRNINKVSEEEPIIQNNSKSVVVRNKQYRAVHIPHELGSNVPLMVFIHGFGGQAAQWEHQLEYFSSAANVLAVDLLGCGKSEVSNRPDDYKTESLVDDLEELLKSFPSENKVLICHSYGCCLGAFLYQRIKNTVKAMTLISVKAEMTEKEMNKRKLLKFTPDAFFDLIRALDRRGGIHSQSVNRLLHDGASVSLRTKQLRWNLQSKTFVWKNMFLRAKWIGRDDVGAIECPILLLTGQDDKICSKSDMLTVHEWCRSQNTPAPVVIPRAGHNPILENYHLVMRQNDDEHCPEIFIAKHPEIGFVIDITKDPPPYVTSDFEDSHITYIKLSTVSKIPPSREETRRFIQAAKDAWNKKPDKQIAVHCHYGFNRTGFMICCFMIEELGVSVTDAIKYFEEARKPKGI
ncbi:9869_t:CDS:2, partial [Acaulospora colombiana]